MRGSAQLGQVDVVGLQAAQRTLDRGEYPTPRGALPVGVVAHGAAERRRQYHAVAAPLELADDLLGVAVAIRSVDEVDQRPAPCGWRGPSRRDRGCRSTWRTARRRAYGG